MDAFLPVQCLFGGTVLFFLVIHTSVERFIRFKSEEAIYRVGRKRSQTSDKTCNS